MEQHQLINDMNQNDLQPMAGTATYELPDPCSMNEIGLGKSDFLGGCLLSEANPVNQMVQSNTGAGGGNMYNPVQENAFNNGGNNIIYPETEDEVQMSAMEETRVQNEM